MKTKIQVGDWIRFYNSGMLVIGIVEYTKKEIINTTLCTDQGCCTEDDVLEVRRATKKGEQ